MNRPSRSILRDREAALGLDASGSLGGWIAVSIGAGLLWLWLAKKWDHSSAAACFVLVMAFVTRAIAVVAWVTRRLARQDGTRTICAFARSFDFRHTDTLVIRAVFERLQVWLGAPVRRDDDLFAYWDMDALDFDDAVEEISSLTQRPLAGMERNPYYGKVCTPGDMVQFFLLQPRSA